jgi:Flp pilus assembly protein TadG
MRDWRGQSLVEFALILPVLVLLSMALLDFGRVVFAQNTITSDAREGARLGSVGTWDFTEANAWLQRYQAIRDHVKATSPGVTLTDADIKGKAGVCLFPLPVDPVAPTYCFYPNFNAADPASYIYVEVHTAIPLLTPLIERVVGSPIQVDGISQVTIRS